MSRRSNASNARNAPFGTDIQPTVKTRIIGGKTVEIAVKTPPASVGSRVSSGSLQTGPHGTPPMQYQPPVNESNHGSYNNNPNPLPGNYRNIYSQTAPRDSSNSHIHGKGNHYDGRPGAPRALPPIHALDHSHDHGDDDDVWSEDMAQEDLPNIKDILQKPFPVHMGSSPALSPINNKRSLTDQVSEHLVGYDPLHFKEMYTELAEFDHGLLGYVSQPQMNMIAHKHKVPIPISTLRLLFSNFAKGSNPDQVNYEKLIQFLARAQLGSAKAQTLLEDDVKKFVHETNGDERTDHELERLNAQIKRYEEKERKEEERKINEKRDNKNRKEQEKWKPSFDTRKPLKTFSELEDAMLIRMLEEQFTDGKKKQTINTEGMREMCLKKDRQKQGTFSRRDLDDLFLYYRIPVQGSLLNKMIQRIDTGDGQLSWVAFLEILERVDSGDAMTPRGEKSQSQSQNHSQRRASEDPNLASIGSRNSFGNSPRNSGSQRERSGNRSRDGHRPHAGGLAPVIEPRRPSTWPKRPFKEVLPPPEEPKKVTSPPWLRKPLARIDPSAQAQEPDNDVTSVEMEITRNDTPTEDHASIHSPPSTPSPKQEGYEIDQLRQMAEEHQRRHRGHRPVEQEVVMKAQQKKNEKREREEWFKGFVHLAKGLYSTDTSKTGCLEREEMLRLVNNYNLIYQLGISSSHIKRVVETCCHEGDQVPIKPVIEILRQKRK